MRTVVWVGVVCCVLFSCVGLSAHAANMGNRHFAWDSIGGTLARDHQSRAMYFAGEHRRTYVVYMDHSFFARITYYDHDTQKWVYPAVLLDDCIRPDDRFNHAYKDGHNVPNLFVTRDGTIHVFYGAHGTVFRYARTKSPENIMPGNWDLDMRVGADGTYPFFSQIQDGTLQVFYRYGPTGGYKNPFLGLQTTTDNGDTWSEIQKLATFPEACKIYRGAYDPAQNRVHLLISPRGPLGGYNGAVHCMYEPEAGKLLSLTGAELGPMGSVESFQAGVPAIFYGMVDFVIYEGKPSFLYEDKEGRYHFGYWQDDAWVELPDSEGKFQGLAQRPVLHTTDGKRFRVYGIADWDLERELYGGDVRVWESTDGGQTWSDGMLIADREEFGHGFQEVNKVMNYSGEGPFLIVAEPTGPWPEGWEKTDFTHYDNPSRRDKRLYALDVEGNVIGR